MIEMKLLFAFCHGDKPFVISFHDEREIDGVKKIHHPPLSDCQISARIEKPNSTDHLSALAISAKRAAILLDDIARPTKVSAMLSVTLNELMG